MNPRQTALIVGAGSGLSAALARLLAKEGFHVALAARDTNKLSSLSREIQGVALKCDATDFAQVEEAFAALESKWGVPDLVVYNASYRTRGPVADLNPKDVERALAVCAFGGFLVGQAAAKRMLARASGSAAPDSARQSGSASPDSARQCAGAIFFTGASASVKGYAESAPFAMGKFALRALAQSMARELAPKNIHVAHFVIDGGIRAADDPRAGGRGEDGMLRPEEIAKNYLHLYRQQRSAWTWELELRPWLERF